MNQNRARHLMSAALFISIMYFHEWFAVKLALLAAWGILGLYDSDSAVDSVFFFAAFFVGVGFFQNPFFTVKHFHLALGFLFLARIIRQKTLPFQNRENWRHSPFLYWIFLLALSIFSLWWIGEPMTHGLKTTGNLFLTLLCAVLLSILLQPEDVTRSLIFLSLGTCVRAFLGILTQYHVPGPYLKEVIVYNNHLGFYCSIALFCLMPYIITGNNWVKKYSILAFCFLFYALLLTCSRTSYVGFFGGLIAFLVLPLGLRKKGIEISGQRPIWILLSSVCLGSIVILLILGYLFPFGYLFPVISSRLWAALILFTPRIWEIVFSDKHNFGFLGHYRMEQFQILGQIVKQHPIFGIGLAQRVTDFHSLYFTWLGGTGLVGLFAFFAFCGSWVRRLFTGIIPNDPSGNLFRLSLLSCIITWLFCSLTESFFLQFNIWIIISAGIIFSK